MSTTKTCGSLSHVNLVNVCKIIPLTLIVLALLAPNFSYGQSTWQPRTGGGGGGGGNTPPYIPPQQFDIPNMNQYQPTNTMDKTNQKRGLSAEPDSSFYNRMLRLRATGNSSSLFHPVYYGGGDLMFSWLLGPASAGLFSPVQDSGLSSPNPTIEENDVHDPAPSEPPRELHYGKKFRISAYYTCSYVKLEELNTRLIDYELNELDYRNHESMENGSGFGLVLERYFDRWSWQFSFEWLNLESTDRQSWTFLDPDTDEYDSVRDEQIVQVKTMAGAVDFKRLFPVSDVLLSVGVGVEARRIEMNVGYRFGEPMMYDYWTEPKVVPGVRAIAGFSTGLGRTLVLNFDVGYRLLTSVHPSIEGTQWMWESPSDEVEAEINLSGFFWNAGVGVQF